jgi:hypothetical protein
MGGMRKRRLGKRWTAVAAIVVTAATGAVAYADTISPDGDVLRPNNKLQYGPANFQEPCGNRGSAVPGSVTVRFNGLTHYDDGATLTVSAVPDTDATAAGITATGGTGIVPAPWDGSGQTFAVPITTTVPASTPDGSYTVNVRAVGPAHNGRGEALTFAVTNSYEIAVDCGGGANNAPVIDWNAHPFRSSTGDTKTYTFGISDLDSFAWTFAAGYPDCGSNGTLAGTPTIDSAARLASFDCTFGGTPGTSNVRVRVTDGTAESNELSQEVDVGVGPLASIAIAPHLASILPGGSQAYTAEGFDGFGNSRGDSTAGTSFSITNGSCTGAVCTATTYGAHTVTGTRDGFSDTATLNVRDVLAPVTTASLAPAAVNGWYVHPTVTLTATDTGSGVDFTEYRLDGGAFQTYTAPFAVSGDGSHTLDYRSVDLAGNVETTQSLSFQIDATPPTIAITVPGARASYDLGQVVNAAFSCNDTLSGLDTCTGTVPNGSPIDTSTIGPHTFTVGASDKAGNPTSRTVTYNVVYPFGGFFSPVDNPPTVNTVQAGSAVPIKFSLGGDRGLAIFASGYPRSGAVSCASGAPQDDIEETVNPGASSLSYAGGQYHYVWKTEKGWKGTCRVLEVKLVDGSVHTALFKFK